MRRLLGALDRAAVAVTNGLLVVVTVVLFVQVFTRYVLNATTPWSEVLARSAIVWMTLLGLGPVIRRIEEIRIDILDRYVLRRRVARTLFGLAIEALELTFLVVLIVSAARLLPAAGRQRIPGLGVPQTWVYVSFIVGPTLALPFLVERIVALVRDRGRADRIDAESP